MMQSFQVVEMTGALAEGRGRVHYLAWEETYRGLMPDALLDSRTEEQCIERARHDRTYPTLVAVAKGEVIGFVTYAPQARDFYGRTEASEIISLYVLKACQRQGAGKALLSAAIARLPQRRVVLSVLQGNENAVRFYRKMGFAFTGRTFCQQTPYGELTEQELPKQS